MENTALVCVIQPGTQNDGAWRLYLETSRFSRADATDQVGRNLPRAHFLNDIIGSPVLVCGSREYLAVSGPNVYD